MFSPELGGNEDCAAFKAVVMAMMGEKVPAKKKQIHAKDGPFITKALRKENMHRNNRLRYMYNKEKTEEDLKAFKKQRNKHMKLLNRTKFEYYRGIDLCKLTDNHKFWKTVKPLFSDKEQVNSYISLIGDGKMVNQDSQIADMFSKHFANITGSLWISVNDSILLAMNDILDPVDKNFKKNEAHPSIYKVSNTMKFSDKFQHGH